MIRFRFSPEKANAGIYWILRQNGGCLDILRVLMTCYLADRHHVNEYQRPVFGASYKATPIGPIANEIYRVILDDPLMLQESGLDHFPWNIVQGSVLHIEGIGVNVSPLSQTDLESLTQAHSLLGQESKLTRQTALTHQRDWQMAELGPMRYEDMLDYEDNKLREDVILEMSQTAKHLHL